MHNKLVTPTKKLQMPQPMFEIEKSRDFFMRPVAHEIDFYLSGVVAEADRYVDWFDVIRNSSPHDIIHMHINSPGGSYFTAVQFRRVMMESPANIVCHIEGECSSAATFIFLSGNMFSISEGSSMLIHDYSEGMYAKGNELYKRITHGKATTDRFMRSVYEGFLSPDEINSVVDGLDMWLDEDQIGERVDSLIAYRESLESEDGDCDCDSCRCDEVAEEEVVEPAPKSGGKKSKKSVAKS